MEALDLSYLPQKEAAALARALDCSTFIGLDCRRSGGSERYSAASKDGYCVACSRTYALEWHAANREHKREADKARRAANIDLAREKGREAHRQWRVKNPERDREIARKSRLKRFEADPQAVREAKRNWKAANPDKVNAVTARRRARKRNATPALTRHQRQQMEGTYALGRALGMHVDHVNPLTPCRDCGIQGAHEPGNLILLDPETNIRKNNRCLECFLALAA